MLNAMHLLVQKLACIVPKNVSALIEITRRFYDFSDEADDSGGDPSISRSALSEMLKTIAVLVRPSPESSSPNEGNLMAFLTKQTRTIKNGTHSRLSSWWCSG